MRIILTDYFIFNLFIHSFLLEVALENPVIVIPFLLPINFLYSERIGTKTYKNGCNLVWYGSEPDEIIDGEAFVMKFDVSSTIPSGTYPIKLIYSNGTDVNLEPVVFEVVDGSIIIL